MYILNMHKQGYTLNQIAAVVEVSPEQIEKVLNFALDLTENCLKKRNLESPKNTVCP